MAKKPVQVYLTEKEMAFLKFKITQGVKMASYIRYLLQKEMKKADGANGN
jgi:hypothetical protein